MTLALVGACLVVGCDKDADREIRVYAAPKDPPAPVRARPIVWKLPAGWSELPDQGPSQFGRFATIQVSADDPTQTLAVNQVSSGDLLSNLNRWEGQLGLPATSAAEVQNKVKVIRVEGHDAYRVDLTGNATNQETQQTTPQRMLAVILPEGDGAWSFLLKGPLDKVAAQESNFDAFVTSVEFPGHNHDAHAHEDDPHSSKSAAPATSQPRDDKRYALTTYTAPPGWVLDPSPRDMRTHTFFAGTGNERAEVWVTKLPADGFGSMLLNVNRWRRQVGLPDTDDEHKENVAESSVAGSTALVFDFAGPDKRSLVAMIVKGREVWFFRMLGPTQTVADQRANFDAFLQSLKFEEAG